VANRTAVDDAAIANSDSVADSRILDHRVGTNHAVAAQAGIPKQLDERLDDRVRADGYVRVDHASVGTEYGHAAGHQIACLLGAEQGIERCQFQASIDS